MVIVHMHVTGIVRMCMVVMVVMVVAVFHADDLFAVGAKLAIHGIARSTIDRKPDPIHQRFRQQIPRAQGPRQSDGDTRLNRGGFDLCRNSRYPVVFNQQIWQHDDLFEAQPGCMRQTLGDARTREG